jgi:hypothetical protein
MSKQKTPGHYTERFLVHTWPKGGQNMHVLMIPQILPSINKEDLQWHQSRKEERPGQSGIG